MAKELHEQPDPKYDLEMAPEELAGRMCAEPETVRWVARMIDNPLADPSDCPDPFAWTLLRQCRANAIFLTFFIEKLWAKLLKPQQETADDDGRVDGQVTIDMIGRIQEIARKATQQIAE